MRSSVESRQAAGAGSGAGGGRIRGSSLRNFKAGLADELGDAAALSRVASYSTRRVRAA
jgi:hypothetical protein